MLVDDEQAPPEPAYGPAFFLPSVVLLGAFVYLAYHSMRGQGAWGLEGQTLRLTAWACLFGLFGIAWFARRRMARR